MTTDIREVEEYDDMLARAEEDGVIGKFMAVAILEHCDDEKHAMQFLTSLIINMSVNKFICPACFSDLLADAVDKVFERTEDADGEHTMKLRFADEISKAMKEGETSH